MRISDWSSDVCSSDLAAGNSARVAARRDAAFNAYRSLAMRSIDFTGKTVLVVGGTSGIGNGIACGFRDQGAAVNIWGNRPSLADYDGSDGCDYAGLHLGQVDRKSVG